MSLIHKRSERPTQWRVTCRICGKEISENLRMHSQLNEGHLAELGLVKKVDPDLTYVQCNVCGNVRPVGATDADEFGPGDFEGRGRIGQTAVPEWVE